MTVQALIQAAGVGSRLGLGPKAFVTLDGRTLLERAVALFDGIATETIIAVPASAVGQARALIDRPGVTIVAGGASRSETTRLLIEQASAPWIVLHDVVHPFATPELAGDLLTAARRHGAAAPGIANTEFLYNRSGQRLHAPGDTLVGQKPVAFSREAAMAGYGASAGASHDPSLMEILQNAGVTTHFIAGSARNIKITSPDDLDLAEALIARDKARARIAYADDRAG